MPFSAIHRKRFEAHLAKMSPEELVKLGVETRRKRDTSNVGVATQLVAAIPSGGSTLIVTALWSGPLSGYYTFKYRTVKKAIRERGLALPPRRFRDIAIPATIGIVTTALGAGADGFDHPFERTELPESQFLNHSQDLEEPALDASAWASEVADAMSSTVENHSLAVENPAIAAELATADFANAYDGQNPEGLQQMADNLEKVASMIMPGGEPLFSAESAQVFGSVGMGIVIGEAAGKGIEKLFPDSPAAPNGLPSTKVQRDDYIDQENSCIDRRSRRVKATMILCILLVAGLILVTIHVMLIPDYINPQLERIESIEGIYAGFDRQALLHFQAGTSD